jgi:P27 family predicted phage terminase small subunit
VLVSAKPSIPRAPAGLGSAGRSLWRSILGDLAAGWELDARELYVLERACRCADDMAALEAAVKRDGETVTGSRGQVVVHPALAEVRQLRLLQLRLLGALEMTDPSESRPSTAAGRRASKAAQARWDRNGRIGAGSGG